MSISGTCLETLPSDSTWVQTRWQNTSTTSTDGMIVLLLSVLKLPFLYLHVAFTSRNLVWSQFLNVPNIQVEGDSCNENQQVGIRGYTLILVGWCYAYIDYLVVMNSVLTEKLSGQVSSWSMWIRLLSVAGVCPPARAATVGTRGQLQQSPYSHCSLHHMQQHAFHSVPATGIPKFVMKIVPHGGTVCTKQYSMQLITTRKSQN